MQRFVVAILLVATCSSVGAEEPNASLIFLATFDQGMDAELGQDRRLRTAASLERKVIRAGNTRSDLRRISELDGNRRGAFLRFGGKDKQQITMFSGLNSGYRKQNWDGTVSFWLRLNPDHDLAPGYCDPIQLTDSRWNDGSFFVDFDKDLPRVFRLGVFSEYAYWNPQDRPWEKIGEQERPMVVVRQPPFQREKWTHVAWTFRNLNASDQSPGEATLYLNGKSVGQLKRPLQMDWDQDQTAVMLGIAYTGDFDELALFDRCLSAEEISRITSLDRTMTAVGDE